MVSAAEEPLAYARRMMVNAATSWWRRPARRERPTATGELPADRSGPPPTSGSAAVDHRVPDHAEHHARRDELLAALRALPRRQRVVLVLRYYEGLDDPEIADLMHIGTSTVRSNAARGITTPRVRLTTVEAWPGAPGVPGAPGGRGRRRRRSPAPRSSSTGQAR